MQSCNNHRINCFINIFWDWASKVLIVMVVTDVAKNYIHNVWWKSYRMTCEVVNWWKCFTFSVWISIICFCIYTNVFFVGRNCQLLSITLNEVGIENVALHGMIPQKQRLASLAKFKSNTVRILIATDVASRGNSKICYVIVFINCNICIASFNKVVLQ